MFKKRKLEIPTLDEALPELAVERLLKIRVQAEASQLKSDIATLRASIQRGVANDGRNERVAAILRDSRRARPTLPKAYLPNLVARS